TFDESSNPSETREFTFTLSDNEDLSLEVDAALNPPLPVAYDMTISTEKGESVTDTLKADYATSFTIESQPSYGTVTLLDEAKGVFGYEPDEDFKGEDSFSFTATNSTGTSNVSNVDITNFEEVNNLFVYDGQTYPLEGGFILDYGEFTEGFRNHFFIITEKEEFYFIDDSINSNYYMYLDLESVGPESFDPGTYVYSSTTIQSNHLYSGLVNFLYADDPDLEIDVTAGEVTVSISGDIYTLHFDLILENGKSLIGSISYPFTIIDESSQSKMLPKPVAKTGRL
ncbi:MAG: Ig-like domain-containing protein, partial [Candidatus Paceibacterota bacterium]